MPDHYILSDSAHDGTSALVDLRLSPAEAFTLAMNLLAGVQSHMEYAAEGGTVQSVRTSFVATVEVKRDA
jgi:hypothetical protein